MKASVFSIAADVCTLAAEVRRLQGKLDTSLTERDQLRARVAELEAEVKTTQELWDATGTDNTDLRAQLATAIEALEKAIRAMRPRDGGE